ncbi:hypothetical protein LCGC14_2153230, partial [marine sediment metagenome]
MAQIIPQLSFSKQALTNLAGGLAEYLDDLDSMHSKFFRDISVWWKWYEAIPKVKIKTTPWSHASNVIVPVIRAMSDSIIAREYALIHSHNRIWTGSTQNESMREFAIQVPNFLNWAARDNEFDMLGATLDWSTEKTVIGESVLGARYEIRERYVLIPHQGKRIVRAVVKRGPQVEHIPREQILWDPGRSIQDSLVVSRQSFLSYTDMVRFTQLSGWDKQAVEEAKEFPETNSPAWSIAKEREQAAGRTLGGVNRTRLPHDVRTVWIDWPMVKGMNAVPEVQGVEDKSVNIVVTFHVRSRKILSITADPLGLGRKPFYHAVHRKRSGRATGEGIAKILEMGQRIASTLVNQSMDAITLANNLILKTTDAKIASGNFSIGKPLLVGTMGDVEVMGLPKQILPDIALL